MSSPTSASSSAFLLMASADLLPRGSSPFFFSGLRSVSKILRNAPLLARSPRKPSSSFNSILKLSTSTDGRRLAPWRAMPVVVITSSAILPLPAGKPAGQRQGNPLVSWGGRVANGEWGVANRPLPDRPFAVSHSPLSVPNPSFLAGFQASLP